MENKNKGAFMEPFAKRQLASVNKILSDGSGITPGLRIDEVAIVGDYGKIMFSISQNGRGISGKNLVSLAKKLKRERDAGDEPVIIGLEGQESENFDLMVPVAILDENFEQVAEYHVFGNYLGGTLEDLKTAKRWIEAQNVFFCFAESACQMLHTRLG